MLQQITDILYIREIPEKFPNILLLLFISSCYFNWNAHRDRAAEKKIDIVIQMAVEHVLIQRFKKKEMGEKSNF